jgi:antitoxin (DNA-binding transcriptional repressor) of toxin-antitoxin stability system
MSTITVSELKRKPTAQWREAARAGDLVATEQGEPVAVLEIII